MMTHVKNWLRPALILAAVWVAHLPASSVWAVTYAGTGSDGILAPAIGAVFDTDLGTVSIDGGSALAIGDVQSDGTVYDFSLISLGSGTLLTASGANPLILLSFSDGPLCGPLCGNVSLQGMINVSGAPGLNGSPGPIDEGGGGAGGGGGGGSILISAQGLITVGSNAQLLANGGDSGVGGLLGTIGLNGNGNGGNAGAGGVGAASGGGGAGPSAGGSGGGGGAGPLGGGGGGGGGVGGGPVEAAAAARIPLAENLVNWVPAGQSPTGLAEASELVLSTRAAMAATVLLVSWCRQH